MGIPDLSTVVKMPGQSTVCPGCPRYPRLGFECQAAGLTIWISQASWIFLDARLLVWPFVHRGFMDVPDVASAIRLSGQPAFIWGVLDLALNAKLSMKSGVPELANGVKLPGQPAICPKHLQLLCLGLECQAAELTIWPSRASRASWTWPSFSGC